MNGALTRHPKSIGEDGNTVRPMWILISLIGLLAVIIGPAWAGQSTQVMGTWRSLQGLEMVTAEIHGESVNVVLPRLDWTGSVDRPSIRAQLKASIKQQKAVFHLYADDLRQPIRKNNMLFATDVYLQDLKITFVGYLRQLGCAFTISKTAAHEDDAYLRRIQSGQEDDGVVVTVASKTAVVASGTAAATALAAAFGSGFVTTSFDSVPSRVVPPAARRMKAEIEARVAALKSKPYKSSPLKIDGLRWASGKIGKLQASGVIVAGEIEGQKFDLQLPVPAAKNWYAPKLEQGLTGQSCEYIILRDRDGAELKKDGRLALHDVYLTDLGLTWPEWLAQQGVTASLTPITDPDMATGPIVLKVKIVHAVWLGVNSNNSIKVQFKDAESGLTGEEIVRAPLSKLESEWTAEIGKKLDARLKNADTDVTLLLSPRETWYTEMGCKKTNQLYFPKLKTNLAHILAELTGKE